MSRAGELSRLVRSAAAEGRGHHERGRGASRVLRIGRRRSPQAKAEIFEALGPGDTAVAPADEPLLSSRAPGDPGFGPPFRRGRTHLRSAPLDVSMSLEGSQFHASVRRRACRGDPPRLRTPRDLEPPGRDRGCDVARAFPRSHRRTRAPVTQTRGEPGRGANAPRTTSCSSTTATTRIRERFFPRSTPWPSPGIGAGSRVSERCCELGPQGPQLHREAGAAIGARVDLLLGVGALAREILKGASIAARRREESLRDLRRPRGRDQ